MKPLRRDTIETVFEEIVVVAAIVEHIITDAEIGFIVAKYQSAVAIGVACCSEFPQSVVDALEDQWQVHLLLLVVGCFAHGEDGIGASEEEAVVGCIVVAGIVAKFGDRYRRIMRPIRY